MAGNLNLFAQVHLRVPVSHQSDQSDQSDGTFTFSGSVAVDAKITSATYVPFQPCYLPLSSTVPTLTLTLTPTPRTRTTPNSSPTTDWRPPIFQCPSAGSYTLAGIETMSAPPSPVIYPGKRRSNMSCTSSSAGSVPANQTSAGQRSFRSVSRRSSQSSVRTVATSHSIGSTATSVSVCSAKFERAYANQSQRWSTSSAGAGRRSSISSQYSFTSVRAVPQHVVGKGAILQKQLKVVELLLKDTPGLVHTETATVGWFLVHERHQLKNAIKYDQRAHAEWEAAHDWQLSAQEGPVSKIFVKNPSKYGLTPEQHQYRIAQALKLGNNAIDLWRFSDLHYQDFCNVRCEREKLEAAALEKEKRQKRKNESDTGEKSTAHDRGETTPTAGKESSSKKDFKSWMKEVTKNGSEALSAVMVKDDGSLDRAPSVKPVPRDVEESLCKSMAPLGLVEETDDEIKTTA